MHVFAEVFYLLNSFRISKKWHMRGITGITIIIVAVVIVTVTIITVVMSVIYCFGSYISIVVL